MKVKPEHQVSYDEMLTLVMRHAATASKLELLAIGSQMVGMLMAMQDDKFVSTLRAMDVIKVNINLGNRYAMTIQHNRAVTEGGGNG